MPTAPPTPQASPADVLGMLGDFFFGFWLGQTITGTVVVAVLIWILRPLRRWFQHLGHGAMNLVKDLRLTRQSTIERTIQEAVDSAVNEVRTELAPAAEPWSIPPEKTEEEMQTLRDEANHRANLRDLWSLSTNRSRQHGYVLHNHAARTAQHVRLDGAYGFEFLGAAEWDRIKQGESVSFAGRIVDAQRWNALSRQMDVHWIDDHGDAQLKRIQVDRSISSTDYWLSG